MKIFVDMDGVLSDFVDGMLTAHDCWIEAKGKDVWFIRHKSGARLKWPQGEYRLDRVLNMPGSRFWKPADYTFFWETLPLMRDGIKMINRLPDPYILTSPSLSPASASGKMIWIRRYLPNLYRRLLIVPAPEKYLLAEGNLLIDDSDVNCSRWGVAGGQAILWPQWWNTAYSFPLKEIEKVIRRRVDAKRL